MNPQILADLRRFYPELILTVALLMVVLGDLSLSRWRRKANFLLTALGLGAALAACIPLFGQPDGPLFFGVLALDPMAVFFKCFLIFAALIVLLATPGSRELSGGHLGEFYALLLGVTAVLLLLASSQDMLMLYLSLETVSIGSYIMVGYLKNDRQSNEASLKYLLFGAVASGAMLYGMTILYGLTGTTQLAAMRAALGSGAAGENPAMLLIATILTLAGFGFKTAAVPFHFWCPDVYTGAPTPVTAFLSVAPKAAGFAILIRFFFTGLSLKDAGGDSWTSMGAVDWRVLTLVISVLTMTLGNIAALRQTNMKRLLAYSSIAHAGYIFMGVVVLTPQGLQSVLIYLITYIFMNLGAFIVVIQIFNHTGSFDLEDYRGMYRRSPFLSISMAVFMLSLMGIPPFAGFFGKLYVFGAAVNADLAWYAVIGALNSVISVYYYARVIKTMIIDSGEATDKLHVRWAEHVLVWIMLLPTAGLMLFWSQIQRWTLHSTKLFPGA